MQNRSYYSSTTRILLAVLSLTACLLDPIQAAPAKRKKSGLLEISTSFDADELRRQILDQSELGIFDEMFNKMYVEDSYLETADDSKKYSLKKQNAPDVTTHDYYKKEQVIAAAKWWINAIQQEIPRIKSIRDAHSKGKTSTRDRLEKNILVYGDNVDQAFTKISKDKQEKFKEVFINEIWKICQYNPTQSVNDHIHITATTPYESSPQIKKALVSALKAASLPSDLFADVNMGCLLTKDGKVEAYVYTGGYSNPPIRKEIYDYNEKPRYKKK